MFGRVATIAQINPQHISEVPKHLEHRSCVCSLSSHLEDCGGDIVKELLEGFVKEEDNGIEGASRAERFDFLRGGHGPAWTGLRASL